MTYTTLFFHKNGYRNILTLLLICLLAFGSYTAQAQNLVWAKSAGGLAVDGGRAVAVDDSGNTYVTGFYGAEEAGLFFSTAAIFGSGEAAETALASPADALMFVAKYTASGNLVWAKGTDGDGFIFGNDIVVDRSGNTYVTGSFLQSFRSTATFGPGEANETTFSNDIEFPGFEFDGAFRDMFVAKYAADGNLVWVKHAGGSNPGGIISGVSGSGIAMDGSGNVYVTGEFTSSATFGPGEVGETTLTSEDSLENRFRTGDIFVAKYTAGGDLVWVKRAGSSDRDGGSDIVVDISGNTYVTGFFEDTATFGPGEAGETTLTSDGIRDIFVAKYTDGGDLVWAKRAGGTDLDTGRGITVDDSGNAYVTGDFSASAIFGLGEANQTALTSDGSRDIFVAKYTAGGDLDWAKRAGGSDHDGSQDIAVDDSGNAYVTGGFIEAATFGTGEADETTLTSDGSRDIFVAKYTAGGDLVSAKRAGGASNDSGDGIAVDDSGNAYVTGLFNASVIFGLGETNQTTLTSDDPIDAGLSAGDIFVAKFSDTTSVNPSVIVESRVAASSDDAEETISSRRVNKGSRNLKLVDNGRRNKLVGLRFNGLTIPQGATITNAYIQFQAEKRDSGATTLLIEGEATNNASNFTRRRANISSRDRTNAAVEWQPVPWTTIGEAGPDQQTPDIASVIQEIVNRSGWLSGNSLAIIISGTGKRTAESFEGDPAGAPKLHVEYTQAAITNQPPVVDAGPDMAIDLPNSASLDGTVNDDDLPSPPQLTTTWSKVSGPGTVSFTNPNAVDTTASFENAGAYVLQLAADDGELSDFDELTVTVNSSGTSTQDLDLVWAKRAGGFYAGAVDLDSGQAIAVDGLGNTYVTGRFGGRTFLDVANTAAFGPGEAGETIFTTDTTSLFVAKYTASGNLVWAKRTIGGFFVVGNDLTVDSSGNIYVTGYFLETMANPLTFGSGEANETTFTSDIVNPPTGDFDEVDPGDLFVAKYTADGNLIWVKRAGGEVSEDQGTGIAVDDSGNAYVTGFFTSTATFGFGEANQTTLISADSHEDLGDIYVAKYTADGDLVWAKRAGGTETDRANDIAVDGSGNAYVTGTFVDATFGSGEDGETTLTGGGSFVANYTADGDLFWVKRVAGSVHALDFSGNIFVTGLFGGSATFGLGEAGETTLTSDGSFDIFAAKYTADGDLIWAKRAGGANSDSANDIAVDSSGNAYITGSFQDSATFGSGEAGETTHTSDGSEDIFVAKYTTDGDLVSVIRAGGTGFDGGNGIALGGSDNAYVTGQFSTTATFGLGEANQTMLTSDGNRDIFVAKFGNTASVNPPVILETRVTSRFDDAEETISSGRVNNGSRNLKLVDNGRRNKLVGMRFNGLTIPQGATITNASIQFQAEKRDSGITFLIIEGEAIDNASAFTRARANISNRDRTSASVEWEPVPWTTIGEAGPDQQTPDITSVIQEIVNRPGWSSGNSLAIIISGLGKRTAESFEGAPAGAPLLHVEYQ